MIIRVKGDVIEIKGELVENHWLALKSAVSLRLNDYPSGIIIDGSKLTEINEAGAKTFLDAGYFIETHHGRIMISGLPSHIESRIRQIPGARSQLPLAPSIEEARASLMVAGPESVLNVARTPAVIVPIMGDWKRGVELARVHVDKRSEIHLLYIIEIPRSLPIGAPLPDEEKSALETLKNAERILAKSGRTVRKLTTRSRTAFEGVGKIASDADPEMVIAAFSKNDIERLSGRQNLLHILCDEVPGNLAFFHLSDQPDAPPTEKKPTVLVALIGDWVKAVEFGARLAASLKADTELLYVLRIPRAQPLDAHVPDEEQAAERILSEAESLIGRRAVVRKRLVHGREFVETAARVASDMKPAMLVLAYPRQELLSAALQNELMCILGQEAPCDVAVYSVISDQ